MSSALDRSASTRSSQNSMSPWSRVIRPILASRPQPPNSQAGMSTALSRLVTVLMTRSCALVRSFIATFSPKVVLNEATTPLLWMHGHLVVLERRPCLQAAGRPDRDEFCRGTATGEYTQRGGIGRPEGG